MVPLTALETVPTVAVLTPCVALDVCALARVPYEPNVAFAGARNFARIRLGCITEAMNALINAWTNSVVAVLMTLAARLLVTTTLGARLIAVNAQPVSCDVLVVRAIG